MIVLVEKDKKLSLNNAKQIIYAIIDGKHLGRSFDEIISEEVGDLNAELDYDKLIEEVLAANTKTVEDLMKRLEKEKTAAKKKKKGGSAGLF